MDTPPRRRLALAAELTDEGVLMPAVARPALRRVLQREILGKSQTGHRQAALGIDG